jgi:transcriptional antiterminator
MTAKLTKKKRLKVIMKHITTCNQEEIAKLCGVSERTIQRDIERWKKNGGFSRFLMKEFFELYGVLKLTQPKYVFDKICDLIRINKNLFEITASEEAPIYNIKWVGGVDKTTYRPES